MKNTLLITEKQTDFLTENRQDPITGDTFIEGDEVVFCVICKSAFLKESWEYMGNRHCGQTRTLRKIPFSKKLRLKKPKKTFVLDLEKAKLGRRMGAYFIDNIFAVFLGAFVFAVGLNIQPNDFGAFALGFLAACIYMVFRDAFGLNGSLGKKISDLYFVDSETGRKAHFLKVLFRNALYWIALSVCISVIVSLEALLNFEGTLGMFLGFFVLVAHLIYLGSFLDKNKTFFDRLLKIELVQKRK